MDAEEAGREKKKHEHQELVFIEGQIYSMLYNLN
jgi:hypothetical protein